LIQLSLDEKKMSQKQLAAEIGISCLTLSDFMLRGGGFYVPPWRSEQYFEQELAIKVCTMEHKITHCEQYFP